MPKRGPTVTPEVEDLIASIQLKHPKWNAPKVRYEAQCILRRDDPSLSPQWPSLSKVQKILAKVRKNRDKSDPQDQPWNMAALDEFPIAPETIPLVLSIQKLMNDPANYKGSRGPSVRYNLTIRQVKWIDRLRGVYGHDFKGFGWALHYSYSEQICQLLGRPFDSTALDEELQKPNPQIIREGQNFDDYVVGLWKLVEPERFKTEVKGRSKTKRSIKQGGTK